MARKPVSERDHSTGRFRPKPAADSPFDHVIPGKYRAEEIAKREAARTEPIVTGFVDEYDRKIHQRIDTVEGRIEPWATPDPLKECLDQNPHPGFKRRFLSDKAVERLGMRGFEVVNKSNGDPVKVGRLTLGEMPTELADRRNRHFREEGNSLIREMAESHADKQESLIREAKKIGLEVLRPGDSVTNYDSTNPSFTEIGMSIRKGDEPLNP